MNRFPTALLSVLLLAGCGAEPAPPAAPVAPVELAPPVGITVFTVVVDGRDVWCVAHNLGSSSAVMSCDYSKGAGA